MTFTISKTNGDVPSDIKGAYNKGGLLWYIDFSSLEELGAFIREYGELVISEDSIEIYNDYRE